MYLIGDIGNTEIKICLLDLNSKIVNRVNIESNLVLNNSYENKRYLTKISRNKDRKKKGFFRI